MVSDQTWFLLKSSSSRSGYIPSSVALTGRRLSTVISYVIDLYLIEGHFEQGWGFSELFRAPRASLGSLGLNSLLFPPATSMLLWFIRGRRRIGRAPDSCREGESRSRQQLHMAPGWEAGGGGGGGGEEGDDAGEDEEENGRRWKGLSFFSMSWTENNAASLAESCWEELEGTCSCHQASDLLSFDSTSLFFQCFQGSLSSFLISFGFSVEDPTFSQFFSFQIMLFFLFFSKLWHKATFSAMAILFYICRRTLLWKFQMFDKSGFDEWKQICVKECQWWSADVFLFQLNILKVAIINSLWDNCKLLS